MENKASISYIALGDSTGTGVGASDGKGGYAVRLFRRIEHELPGSRLVNLCVSGATTVDVLRNQLPRVQASINQTGRTLITLGIGINNLTRNVSVEDFARDYEQIVAQLKTLASDAKVALLNIPDISLAPRVPVFLRAMARRRIVAYNGVIAEIANGHGAILVDTFETSSELIGNHPEFISADGFHPSEFGYEYWAKTMWATVKEVTRS